MNRRDVLFSAAAATAALSVGSPMPANAAQQTQSRVPGDWSAVTYMPLSAQRQLVENREAVRDKPYSEFFDSDLIIPTAAARLVQTGRLDKRDVLTPSVADLNCLLDPSYKTPDHGYAVLENSTTYVQSRIVMPGVTAEMFKWWFTWHPVERERYMLWFPQAHIDNSVDDPRRLQDTSLSYEDRLYNNPNRVKELIGASPMELVIHFTDPAKVGFDPSAFKQAGFTASASGIISPGSVPDAIMSMMIHLGRDIDGGMELVSRYWIGAHPELLRFEGAEKAPAVLEMMGFNDAVAEATAYELSVHDMTEFNHLARILPAVYAKFG